MKSFIVCLFVPCFISAAVLPNNEEKYEKPQGKSLEDCMALNYVDMASCFAVKSITILEKANRMKTINVFPGLSFVANNDIDEVQRNARSLTTEQEVEESLPTESSERSSKMIEMLIDSASRFISSHNMQFSLPKSSPVELQRALDEGRAKIKKKFLPILGLLAVKIFAVLPLLLGVLGFLALKALIIGKLALVIAGVLALQKYSASGSGWGSGFSKLTDTWGSPASQWSSAAGSPAAGGYYRRSLPEDDSAQHLAYNAHVDKHSS